MLKFKGTGCFDSFSPIMDSYVITPTKVYGEVADADLAGFVFVVSALGLPTTIHKTPRKDVFGRTLWDVRVLHKGMVIQE